MLARCFEYPSPQYGDCQSTVQCYSISCYGFSNYKTLASDLQTQLEFQDNAIMYDQV